MTIRFLHFFAMVICLYFFSHCKKDTTTFDNQLKIDKEIINNYLAAKGWTADSTASGLRYIVQSQGGGNYPNANAPTPVTVGDINGDGRDEAIFACSSKLYVVGADPGNASGKILWTLDLGTFLTTPILADTQGRGQLEIVVVGSNGYVFGIGSDSAPPASIAVR